MTILPYIRPVVQTIQNFEKHNGASYAAAMAYHALISLGPCLLLAISVVSRAFDQTAVKEQIILGIASLAGQDIAALLSEMIDSLMRPDSSRTLVAIVTGIIILYASTNVFRQIEIALDAIWEVDNLSQNPQNNPLGPLLIFARRWGLALLASVAIVIALFITMLASTIVGLIMAPMASLTPVVASLLPWLTALALPILLFLICWTAFTLVPNRKLSWKETRNGSLLTGIVLAIGGGIIGYFASHSPIPDLLGVASSIIVLLLWMFFSSLIFLLGAEYTRTLVLNRRTSTA